MMLSTQDTLLAAQAGDVAAISALLALSQPDLRRYARQTCHVDDVDDAVQDALMILHRRVGGLQKAAALKGWLFVVVKRECLRLARWSKRSHADIETFADDAALAARTDHALRLDLTAAIQSLPPIYRQIVLMRDMLELTIGEIASATGDTRASVKARLHRARGLMREYLRQ